LSLIDSDSARPFWYNIRDSTSAWMTDAEAVRFRGCLALAAEDRPAKWLVPMHATNKLAAVPADAVHTAREAAKLKIRRRSTAPSIVTDSKMGKNKTPS
jgi:hypothetical protein